MHGGGRWKCFLFSECSSYTIILFVNVLYRSSEEALEILLKFKHIKTREAIQQQLMKKFDPILYQFTKEVATVEKVFTVSSLDSIVVFYQE